ncbi:cache domain-containing sensor histidine kinase [Paenibacillus sp. URB8-2]|uniref:cache domain-containing sensor histidine kinase n=1 Tax=Paenibacillus sp. URB8-2 TaxID=2741301 RepID=UPI0015BC4CC6|nr:sensor histidine kinase [Paenibacillus sp. URB8-2]BCG58291.1 sensor histidine kinase YesM [Paenibacillus sp. URB8-2]
MTEKYFIKHLATFLIPLLLPLLILGTLSYFNTEHYINADINKNSKFLLIQSQRQLEMILDELNTLDLALYQDAKVFNELSSVLRAPAFTYESSSAYQIIFGYMNALASSKPYIQSIYFYADNGFGRYVSSEQGLSSLNKFNDTAWFDEFMSYNGPPGKWMTRKNVTPSETGQAESATFYNVIVPHKIAIMLNVRPKYIENILNTSTTHKGQMMFILDEHNRVLFANNVQQSLNDDEIRQLSANPSSFFDMNSSAGKVNVTKIESKLYNWKYVSIIPHDTLYAPSSRILVYTIAFSCLSFVCGLILTLILTRRNYRQLLMISSLINSADKDVTLLRPPGKVKDEYSYIMQDMIKHFIEHRYIQTQLSEKKYRLQVMELLALQSQMNPHFLYNTLNSIYWEAVGLTGKPNKASEMIENLSDMLSYSLSNPSTTVTWMEELANTVNYVEIQKKRYRNKFDCFFEYDEEIRPLHTMKLLLQPLIENSLYHGIQAKDGPGLTKVKIVQKADKLRISVIDNGAGIAPDRLKQLQTLLLSDVEQTGHIGLFNTNKRLRLLYGYSYSLKIRSKHGLGTCIEIILPRIPITK